MNHHQRDGEMSEYILIRISAIQKELEDLKKAYPKRGAQRNRPLTRRHQAIDKVRGIVERH